MSNEIATYSMIYNKLNLGTTGNECPTKTLILAISSSITITNESTYGSNECVRIDDINASSGGTMYYFRASYPQTNPNFILPPMNPSEGFINETVLINSYSINSDATLKEFVNFTVTSCPDWLHPEIVGNPQSDGNGAWDNVVVHAEVNDSIQRLGDIVLTQDESGYTLIIHVTQEGVNGGDYHFYPVNPDGGDDLTYYAFLSNNVENYEYHYWNIRSFKGFGPTIEGEYIDFTVTSCPDWIRVVVDDNIRREDDMDIGGGHYYYKQILIIPQRYYDLGTDENPKIIFTQNGTNEEIAISVIANLSLSQDESDKFTFVWSDETTSDKYLNIPSGGAYNLIFEEITSTYRGEVTSDRDWKTEILCMNYWNFTAGKDHSVKDDSVIINAPQNINTSTTNLGVIVLLQQESNKALVVNVNQDNGQTDQYPYHILYSEKYNFSLPYNLSTEKCAIHSYTISYDHEPQLQNTKNCTIVSNPEWLQVSIKSESWTDNSNTSETIYTVSIAPKTINDTTSQREGDIVVQLDESGKTVTLHVMQSGNSI